MSQPSPQAGFVPQQSLPTDRIDVWSVPLESDTSAVQVLWELLSPDERTRAERFAFERDRRRFVVGRGALRSILASYLGGKPAEIRLTYDAHGKPRLADSTSAGTLQFNASGSQELAVCAVTVGPQVGIDIEACRPLDDEVFVEHCLSPAERGAYAGLPPAERPAAFYRLWTRKEAYLKALGEGLSRPLSTLEVTFLRGEQPRLIADLMMPSADRNWTFVDFEPGAPHVGAVVIAGAPRPLVCRRWRL